jgi:hypothetical protein
MKLFDVDEPVVDIVTVPTPLSGWKVIVLVLLAPAIVFIVPTQVLPE